MTDETLPVFEDLGAGRARLILSSQTTAGPKLCEITWYQRSDGVRVIDHTFVPPELNGQGLAAKLTEAALTLAQQDGVLIVPHCSYVARWIERHPAWRAVVSA